MGKTTLPGFISYEDPTGRGTAILVSKTIAATHTISQPREALNTPSSKSTPSRPGNRKEGIFLLNCYCRPKAKKPRGLDATFTEAIQLATAKLNSTLLIIGDFNAAHQTWGYHRNSPRDNELVRIQMDKDLTFLNDPDTPTRLGTNTARDTFLTLLLCLKIEKTNTQQKLRKRIAELNAEAAAYVSELAKENCIDICDGVSGHLSLKQTWNLLRHLIDPTKGKSKARKGITQTINAYKGTHKQLMDSLATLHLQCKTPTSKTSHPDYTGPQIKIGDSELDTFQVGESGTPQVAVISALLFNLTLLHLPQNLQHIPILKVAFYAGDITLWIPKPDSPAKLQDTLQEAADIITRHVQTMGLRCAPQKAELLLINRGNSQDFTVQQVYLKIEGQKIYPTDKPVRLLGHTTYQPTADELIKSSCSSNNWTN
ncbi:hypothetical protein HPB47_006491 [Ixodes persulcatus]|uniref:Uncharacterized protein n=1 Tax=Ixodes persulcatus TaxID=34615 RepID=A0AC60PA14_IXOPE|nr:hypothetical protein HPB47_006491 [Ixodes persulcatus]